MLACALAFYLCATVSATILQEDELMNLYRRETDLHMHEAATAALLSQFDGSADTLKQTLTNALDVTNSSLDPNTTAPEMSRLRLALNTTCQLKTVLETLETAEDAVGTELGHEGGEDVEISVLQTVVKTLYSQSCEWMVATAQDEGSCIDVESTCFMLSDTVNELCSYWDALQLAEAAIQHLQILLTMLQNEPISV